MCVLDRVLRALDVLAHLRRRQAQQVAMPVAVQRDLMAGVGDLARERRVAQHLLADQEERRRHTLAREDLQHRRRALRVRAVVERQRVAAAAGGAVLDAERRARSGAASATRRAPREAA